MTRTVAVVLLLPALVVAAPVPKAAGVRPLAEVFGEVADPPWDCTVEMTKAGALRVAVPKLERPVELDHGAITPPLTTKSVEGDFELTVRVTHAPPKETDRAAGAKMAATVAAGVALYTEGDRRTNLTFAHTLVRENDAWANRLAAITHYGGGSSRTTGGGGDAAAGKPVYLRLTRLGDSFAFASSGDGKKWSPFSRLTLKGVGEVVLVGPTAFHNTAGDHEAVFDEYQIDLIRPLKEPKK